MTKIKDPTIFIEHILDSIDIIFRSVKGMSKKEFLKSLTIQDAAIRRVAIIGEAVKNLAKFYKDQYPTIPWRAISDMRNLVIHEYYDIDLNITWDTVVKDLPKLKRQLEKIIIDININKRKS